MKKVLIGFFLTLSVLLLCRYSQRYAQLYALKCQANNSDALIENVKRSQRVSVDEDQSNGASAFKIAAPDTEKTKYRIDDATEIKEEDDEFGSSKKYVRGTDCVISIFSAFLNESSPFRAVNCLSYASNSSYATSGRIHISLCVIRI